MTSQNSKLVNRARRHKRIRTKIKGTSKRPRISVFKSNKHIFVQFVDDESSKTILSNKVSPKSKKGTKTSVAAQAGKILADKAKDMGIKEAVFDSGGFKYHGRIKALADGLREGGIKF